MISSLIHFILFPIRFLFENDFFLDQEVVTDMISNMSGFILFMSGSFPVHPVIPYTAIGICVPIYLACYMFSILYDFVRTAVSFFIR